MAEARRRALEQFGVELEHEVELPRPARAAAARRRRRRAAAAKSSRRGRDTESAARAAGSAGVPPRLRGPRGSCRPAARLAVGLAARRPGRRSRTSSRARRRSSRSRDRGRRRVAGARTRRCAPRSPLDWARASSQLDGGEVDAARDGAARGRSRHATTARSRTRCASASCRSGRSPSLRRGAEAGSSPRAAACSVRMPQRAPQLAAAHLGAASRPPIEVGAILAAERRARAVAALAPLARHASRSASAFARVDGQLTLVLRGGARDPARRPRDLRTEARSRAAHPADARTPDARATYVDVSVPERPSPAATLNSQVELETYGSRSCVDTADTRPYTLAACTSARLPQPPLQLEVEPTSR